MADPARFVANELRDRPIERQYRLRRSRLIAGVRHPLLDMWALEEIFRFRAYDPPAGAMNALRGLGRPPRLLDLGGHIGLFGLFFTELFSQAAITSFEPDPDNARRLRACVAANGLSSRWSVVEACAAEADGVAELASDYHLSRVTSGGEEEQGLAEMHSRIGAAFSFLEDTALLEARGCEVEARDVFPYFPDADFLKMDIEGSEWRLLADGRFGSLGARALVLEYHPVYCPHPDPEAFVVEALSNAGSETGEPRRSDDAGTLWAWRETSS